MSTDDRFSSAPPATLSPTGSAPSSPPESYFDGGVIPYTAYMFLFVIGCSLTFGLAYPWISASFIDWKLSHTVVEGRRLYFDGTGTQLFASYIKWWLLCLITFGIYTFWIPVKIEAWKGKHTFFA